MSLGIDVRWDARRDGAVGVFERVELSSEGLDLLIDISGLLSFEGDLRAVAGLTQLPPAAVPFA